MKKTTGKIGIKTVIAVAVTLMGAFVFVSNTIFSYNLVSVTAAMPHHGHLHQLEVAQGRVVNARYVELVAGISGVVTQVYVQAGQSVSYGEPILSLDFRGAEDDLQQRITDLNSQFNEQLSNLALSRERHQLDMTRVHTNIDNINHQIALLENETIRGDSVSDFELRSAQEELRAAQADLAIQEQLLTAGAVPLQSVVSAENRVQSATERVANQERIYQENTQRVQNTMGDQQANIDRQLESLFHQLELLNQDLYLRMLDLDNLALQESAARTDRDRRLADYRRQLAHFDQHRTLSAPADGIVTQLGINQGAHLNQNQLVAVIGQGLIVQTSVPLSNSFIAVGSEALMHSTANTAVGTVTNLHLSDTAKLLTLGFDHADIALGEVFTLQFEAVSSEAFTLVPNTAINRGADGYFVNQVRRRTGVMGEEFFTEQIPVYLGESDGSYTVVLRGITFFQPVVVASSRSFAPGETVELNDQASFLIS